MVSVMKGGRKNRSRNCRQQPDNSIPKSTDVTKDGIRGVVAAGYSKAANQTDEPEDERQAQQAVGERMLHVVGGILVRAERVRWEARLGQRLDECR